MSAKTNWYQSITKEQRQKFIATVNAIQSRHNQEALKYAENHRERWTPEDDLILLEKKDWTYTELALLLGRSFFAISGRRAVLLRHIRNGTMPDYFGASTETGPVKKQRVCACAAFNDDEHEDWCPSRGQDTAT